MWKDPIVEEVRAARQKIGEACNFDVEQVLQRHREVLKQWRGRTVTRQDLAPLRRNADVGQ